MALANTDKLTSQLAMLPDNALRQMAQMHKNDPYVLPLIIAEDGRRKQLRMAGQAQQYRPQPKVADAQAAQVGAPLPEEVGIGMLPAPNMAQMAGGGITGDDDVPGYQTGGTVAFHNGENVKRYSGEFGSFVTSAEDLALDELRRQALLRQRAEDARISALVEGRAVPFVQTEAPRVAAPVPATPAAPTQRDEGGQKAPPSAIDAARGAGAKAAPTRAPTVSTPNLSDMYRMARTEADNTADPRLQEIQRQVQELGKSGIEAARENTRLTEERQAKFADAYKGREERLSKREAQLQSDEGKNTGLALLQAGLAIMSTPGNLATAVGKGGQAGLAAYGAGLERLRAAQERLADARDRLDEIKLNRDEMSAKEIQEAKMGEKRAATEAQKAGIDFGMKVYGLSEERAKMFYQSTVDLAKTKLEQEGADRRAAMAASAPPEILKLARAFGGGDIEAGLRKVTEIQAGKFDPRKAYSEYLGIIAKNPGAGEPMNFSQFIAQFAIPTVSGDNSAAPGTTRARP